MFLTAGAISMPETFANSILGFSVVFIGLISIIAIIKIMSSVAGVKKESVVPAAPAAPAQTAAKAEVSKPADAPKAPGSVGEVKLWTVPDRTAALIMAIVADASGIPVNELKFLSIKEIGEER